jgi:RNA-binding protein YlmH
MEKDTKQLEKRLIELSRIAYQQERILFSDFLNLNEQSILHMLSKTKLDSQYLMYGGYLLAERQMAAFYSASFFPLEQKEERKQTESQMHATFPIVPLRIEVAYPKYAQKLSHRDYLGSILGLGIDRCKIGDLLVEDTRATALVHQSLADFICEHLHQVARTEVRVTKDVLEQLSYTPKYEVLTGSVSSIRLDAILSVAFSGSRSKLSEYITRSLVFVNGKLTTSASYIPKEGELISVRGLGKFQYQGVSARTKKEKLRVVIHKYI